jgi:hypothetical protein
LALSNVENKVKIAGAGGIEAIIEGMGTHRENKEVQEIGCSALRIFAFSNAENKV